MLDKGDGLRTRVEARTQELVARGRGEGRNKIADDIVRAKPGKWFGRSD